jgi:hypothetical protein
MTTPNPTNENPPIMQAAPVPTSAPLPPHLAAVDGPSIHEQGIGAMLQEINALKAKLFDEGQRFATLSKQLEAVTLYQRLLNHIGSVLKLPEGTQFSTLPEHIEQLVKERDELKAKEPVVYDPLTQEFTGQEIVPLPNPIALGLNRIADQLERTASILEDRALSIPPPAV